MSAKLDLDLLLTGERRLESIKPFTIVVIGLSRMGKSCVYNYILNNPMIGKRSVEDLSTIYIPVAQNPTMAKMSNSAQSVTLKPNISSLNQNTDLIDLAGFRQNRKASDVLHVSYFLLTLFKNVKNIKFLLTFSNQMITSHNISEMTHTLNEFLNLFNFSSLTSEMKTALFDSVSIVITKAKASHQQYNACLRNKVQSIRTAPQLNIENKELIADLIERLTASKKIYAFKQAEDNVKAPKSDLLEILNRNGWKFLDFIKNKGQLKKNLILPFKRDFDTLTKKEQEEMCQFLKGRTKNLAQGSFQLIDTYIKSLISNWNLASKSCKNNMNQFRKTIRDNRRFMQEVDVFLNNTYTKYESNDFVGQVKFEQIKSAPLLSILDSTIKMTDLLNNYDASKTIQNNLSYLEQQIIKTIKLMGSLCPKDSEIDKLKKVAFVFQRAIHEFLILHQMDPSLLSEFHLSLKDRTVEALGDSSNYFILVMNDLQEQMVSQLFPEIGDLNHFDSLADQYMYYLKNNEIASIDYKKDSYKYDLKYQILKVTSNTVEAHLSLKLPEPIQSSIQYISNLIYQLTQGIDLINKKKGDKKIVDRWNLMLKKYAKILAELLVELGGADDPFLSLLGTQIGEFSNCFQLSHRLYKQALSAQQNKTSQGYYNLFNFYIAFLLKWGHVDETEKLLHAQSQICLLNQQSNNLQQIADNLIYIDSKKNVYGGNVGKMVKKLKEPLNDSELKKLKDLIKTQECPMNLKYSLIKTLNYRTKNPEINSDIIDVSLIESDEVSAEIKDLEKSINTPRKTDSSQKPELSYELKTETPKGYDKMRSSMSSIIPPYKLQSSPIRGREQLYRTSDMFYKEIKTKNELNRPFSKK